MALLYSQPTNHNTVFGGKAAEGGGKAVEVGGKAAEVGGRAAEAGVTAAGFGCTIVGTASYCHSVYRKVVLAWGNSLFHAYSSLMK